jgi:hypothetical protein
MKRLWARPNKSARAIGYDPAPEAQLE